MSVQYARRQFSVPEYNRMAEAGVFHPDDRLELIEGEIVQMSPIGDPHAACVRKLVVAFHRLLGDRTQISVQSPVELSQWSKPQPDIALLAPRADFYARFTPTPKDIQLLVEVSDTTLAFDVDVKVPLYARSGIRETWVIDLEKDQITVYSQLRQGTYRRQPRYQRGDSITSQRFSGVVFPVNELIP